MNDKPFLDTVILVYAVSTDTPRAEKAEALIQQGGLVSVEVLNEFAAVAHRKLKMSWEEIGEALPAVRYLCEPAAAITISTHESALILAARYRYNFYDALILAAALESGSRILYSEDMQHGQTIEGLTIRNPFGSV